MFIKRLSIRHFKNHHQKDFELSSNINAFVGNNGVGKTNILDALHYLSLGKSFLKNKDFNNIQKDADFFSIEADIEDHTKENTIKITLPKEGKKTIKKDGKNYDRLSDYIGFLPSVIISPYDSNLISDASEGRRKFIDVMISQIQSEYLYHLIQYNKALKQRNALLKFFAKNRTFDADSLELYNTPLNEHGKVIFETRKSFLTELQPIIQHYYTIISGGKETISVRYASDVLESDIPQILHDNLAKDRVLTYTSKGVHKDDLIFEMNGELIKRVGSQGQQKSFLIALKLAQMNYVQKLTQKTPILLLDDIFDKLDDHRVSQLIKLVNEEHFGQIFITDTHKERTESIVKRINEESLIFEIEPK